MTPKDDEQEQLRATVAALSLRLSHLEIQLAKYKAEDNANNKTRDGNLPSQNIAKDLARNSGPSSAIPRSLSSLEVPMAATRMVTTQMVTPSESIGIGICMGGTVLSWIDICAGLAAKTLARGPCVTASVDAVHFLRPCHVGSVLIVAAMVNRTFTSSMEVGVRVEEECPLSGIRRHCCSAYLTFVAISPSGGGRRDLPRVVPGASRRLRFIHADAERRRAYRLSRRQRLRDDPQASAAEAACRLHPVTHRVGTPSMPPALKLENTTPGGGSPRARVSPSITVAHATHIIMPQHANSIGITFGGQVLRWVEQAGFVVGARVSRGGHVLTATMDDVTFLKSTRVGDTVYVEAQATAVFGSSVEVMISIWGEVPEEGIPFHCGDAYATVVSVNGAGEPVDIPFEIVPETPEEKRRYEGAVARRRGRLSLREALLRDKSKRVSLDDDDNVIDGMHEESGGDGEAQEEEQSPLVQALAVA